MSRYSKQHNIILCDTTKITLRITDIYQNIYSQNYILLLQNLLICVQNLSTVKTIQILAQLCFAFSLFNFMISL